MALTQSLLKSMGIEADQREQIMQAHQETLESIKAERDALKEEAAKVQGLERQVEALRAADESDEWRSRYEQAKAEADTAKADAEALQSERDALKAEAETAKAEHEAYVQQVEADRADAVKLELYKGVLREIGLDEKRVEKAARMKDLSELSVEDGALAGREELVEAERADWADFIPQTALQVPSFGKGQKSEPTEGQPNPRALEIAKSRQEKLYGKVEE